MDERLQELNYQVNTAKCTAGIDLIATILGCVDVILNIGNVTMLLLWLAFTIIFAINTVLTYKRYKKKLAEYNKLQKERNDEFMKDKF